ncbi:MAG: MFS transporter [Phycisphaerales bacterium]|nr:MFS transporter [Phycisphaerales bacterium]
MHEVGPLPNHGARVSIGSWLAWGAATLFVLYQLATQNSIAAMQVALEKDLAISEVEVGIVSATFLFVYAIMQIPAGMLLDRWRPQFLLPPAALGVAGAACLLSLSGGFWGAVGARALMGAFAAFAFPGAGLVARRRLPASQFALAMGLIDFAFGAGAYLGDAGVEVLMQVQSWQSIMVDFAFAGAVVGFICWLCIGATTSRGQEATDAARRTPLRQSLREVLSVRQVRLAAITAGALMGMLFGFGGLWDVSLQQAFGYSHDDSVNLNSWLFVGVAIVPPFAGWAADRWRKRRPILFAGQIVAFIAVALVLLIQGPLPYWLVAANLLILGMGIGTCVLTFPIACDAVAPANAGAALGVVNAAGLLSSAVFQVVPGIAFHLADSHSLLIMRIVMAIFAVAVAIGAWATWQMKPCPPEPR